MQVALPEIADWILHGLMKSLCSNRAFRLGRNMNEPIPVDDSQNHSKSAALLAMAMAELKAGNLSKALTACKGVLKHEPKNVFALEKSGEILTAQNKHKAACAFFRQLCHIKYKDYKARVKLADALSNAGHWDEAAEAYRLATRMPGNQVDGFLSYARTLTHLKSYEEALDVYRQVKELFPDADYSDEAQAIEELLRESQASTLSLFAKCQRLFDPDQLMPFTEFDEWVEAVPWLSKCRQRGELRDFQLPDSESGQNITIKVRMANIYDLPNEDKHESILGKRQDALEKITLDSAQTGGLNLEPYAESLKQRLSHAFKKPINTLVNKIHDDRERREDEADSEDSLEAVQSSIEYAEFDAFSVVFVIGSMLKLNVPVPPDVAIRWLFFALGYWPCELIFWGVPEDYTGDNSDYVREMTLQGEKKIWKNFEYLVW